MSYYFKWVIVLSMTVILGNSLLSSERLPNILIVYADDLGYGDLGCYGATVVPTPNLDALARTGLRFTDAYATASTCTPSRYSLLTGKYPIRKSGANILPGDAGMLIDTDELTIASALKPHGYTTAVIGKWHLGLGQGRIDWNGPITPSPLDLGFDRSYIMAATNDRVPCVYVDGRVVDNLDPEDPITVFYGQENPFPDAPTGRLNPELLTVMKHSDKQHWDSIINGVGRIGFSQGGTRAQWDDATMADVFLDKARDFISENKARPFFLYYALHQPHVPRVPGHRFSGTTSLGPRGDTIAELDWCVGEIVMHLEQLGIREQTLVVFSSDNGPVLDDGYLDEAVEKNGGHRSAGVLRGGKYSLFEGGARVPMIVNWPEVVEPGVSNAVFSQVDLLGSLLALAGSEVPAERGLDTMDMLATLTGKSDLGRPRIVYQAMGTKPLLREGQWVYIPPYGGPAIFHEKNIELGNSEGHQLYNIVDDPSQQENLASRFPGRTVQMAETLASILGNQ